MHWLEQKQVAMKTITVLFLAIVLAVASVSSTPLDQGDADLQAGMGQDLKNFLTAFQHMMPCGDPALNLPVLAPFRVPFIPLDIDHELLVLKGSIKNLVVAGLDSSIIINLSTNAATNRTSFDCIQKEVQILGEFDLHVDADLAGYKFHTNLSGLMDLQLLDVRGYGGLSFTTNKLGGTNITGMVNYVDVGDVVSHIVDSQWSVVLDDYINKWIREASLLWSELNREYVNQQLSGFITQEINQLLYKDSLSQVVEGMKNLTQKWNAISCNAN